ncbi:MAG: class I SAM-dependent methyltransferase [Candidatus Omnitrophota bacterium]|nr:class I SAM-dependent methyltransferase [Candidatus Omnitrophota bacterium]
MSIDSVVSGQLENREGIWFGPSGGYWSNLDKNENDRYVSDLSGLGSRKTVQCHFPQYFDVIFSDKRAGGLLLLDPRPGDIVVDAGCMWGALTVPLARAGCNVIAVDQTRESLLLLKRRLTEEGLTKADLVCADLRKLKYKNCSVDKFLVNGVLEWIPEEGTVELKKYYGKRLAKKYERTARPCHIQTGFLKTIYDGLKNGGQLYLAIENRFDIFNFLGLPDPHCNIRFITFLPRIVQDLVSKAVLGRPYVNWTYSRKSLRKMLISAGFKDVRIFYAFPDYRFPEYILTDNGMRYYRPCMYKKGRNIIAKAVCYAIEDIVFRRLRLGFFSQSFVVLARK